jgi:NitT/TauT family transport system substrate-binding protein
MKFAALLSVAALLSGSAPAADKPAFTVGWSIYVGWNPYHYMDKSGILKKWADKYGVSIRVQRFDYAPSLEAFVAKSIDACTMTNMEALDMPAAAGVDTTAVILGDYSNGNDALLVRNGLTFNKLAGKRVMLVQKTVSEYLFERGMTMNGAKDEMRRVKLVNTSDSDIAPAFLNNPDQEAVVTWKPLVSQIRKGKGVTTLFTSAQIPGEILDLLVIRTDVLQKAGGQNFAKAVTGAWYEAMSQLSGTGALADKAMRGTAAASEDSVDSLKEQLSTTHLFSTPQSAVQFLKSPDLKQKMDLVRQFCFTHGLLGEGTKAADDVAILYPDGSVQGKKERVRLRFDPGYMQLAALGKL